MIDVPPRFLINNRPIDNEFEENESLYLRFSAVGIDSTLENRLPVAAIKFPDVSVNRGKYSQPTDVLIPFWIQHGIAELEVGDIPSSLMSGDEKDKNSKNYDFKVEHDPVGPDHPSYQKYKFENYAHSEIRVYKDSVHQKTENKVKIPTTVKKKFRTHISDMARLLVIIDAAPTDY